MSENMDLIIEDSELEEEIIETQKPQVIIDESRYWTGQYSIVGSLAGGIEVDVLPEETDLLRQKSCKWLEDNSWYFDEEKYKELLKVQEISKQVEELQKQVTELKTALNSTQEQIVECYECNLVGKELPYDVIKLHEERQAIRDEISALETEIENCNLESSVN